MTMMTRGSVWIRVWQGILVLWISVFSISARAQSTLGYNAVCASSMCASASNTAPSGSFIDASVSANINGTDLCRTIYNILISSPGNPNYPPNGAVIDARGLTNLGCANGTPWNNGTQPVAKPGFGFHTHS